MADQDTEDWRLTGQERYLADAHLAFRKYRQYRANRDWDHDHCEFCGAKFTRGQEPGALHEGYSTLDEYRWICSGCFEDFRVRFNWVVVPPPPDA